MVEKGEKHGIHRQNVTLINYTSDSLRSGQTSFLSYFEQSGYPAVHGIFHFREGDAAYQMSFDNVLFLPEEAGWYGATLVYLTREGGPLEADHGRAASPTAAKTKKESKRQTVRQESKLKKHWMTAGS